VPQEIAGRDAELELARAWLAQPGARALVFAGEAGIGKTTLWRQCVDEAEAAGACVLVTAPSDVESGLPYAAMADLFRPLLPEMLDSLPARQRRALAAALVLEDDGSTLLDERAVAFAALTALRETAGEQQLVIAIDDEQWLDPSSALALSYALRRVAAEDDVRALLARRTTDGAVPGPVVDAFPPEQIETLHVGPLSLGALHRAIRNALGAPLARPALVRIHEASGGRPLHALELARALSRASQQALPGGGVDELLRNRVAALPDPARHALLVAACSTDSSLATLDVLLDESAERALAPALEAGLVRVVDRTARLTHPLLADAVVADAGPEEVASVHRMLAATARTVEERALHLARATGKPDASIAASLDEAVASARARGAPSTAADLAELAAAVTPADDEGGRLSRVFAAADAAFVAGDVDRARTLFAAIATERHPLRYRALWRLGVVLDETVGADAAIGPLLEALGTGDQALASAVHRSIAQLLLFTGDLLRALEHADAAVSVAERSGAAVELAYSLGVLALVRHLTGQGDWRSPLELALLHERSTPLPSLDLCPSAVAADIYRLSLELDRARAAYSHLRDLAAGQQDVGVEAWAGYGLAQVALLSGRLADAGRLARERLDLSEQTGMMRLPALRCLAHHAALTGDVDGARQLLADLVTESEELGELLNLRGALVIEGQLALSLGDTTSAVHALRRARLLAEQQHVSHDSRLLALADEVEALALAGKADDAVPLMSLLENAQPPWAAPLAARAAGLVAAARGDLAAAVARLRAATESESTLPLPLEQARSWLALGRTLRRAKRRGEAREALNEALRRFEALGVPLWAAQAEQELGRISGRAPAHSGLTPTERQVAGLVAAGRSNKETAAALFLTVKTVEVTLTRVYRKLGVRGRGELAARHDELLKQ
jgi:DNA-binding CsgD family transcriptional regulator